MRKTGMALIFAGITLLGVLATPAPGAAGVTITIGFPVPFPLVVLPPPPLVMVPDPYLFSDPRRSPGLSYRAGYWYRPHEGHWYRSRARSGPWHCIQEGHVHGEFRSHSHRDDYDHRGFSERRDRSWGAWERGKH